jgi:glucokinase
MTDLLAGVDLGGTNLTVALGTAEGRREGERKIPTRAHEGPQAVLERIAQAVRELSKDCGASPRSLGMGVPGLVDREAGVTTFLPNLPTQWKGVPVSKILGSALGCEVHLLNDVRTATLGELVFGLGRGVGTMAFFALGTGVGGGIVVDGKLRLGPLGAAGELGHETILPDGARCGCGNRGCLETLASGPAIEAEGVRLELSGLAPRLRELTAGDPRGVTTEAMGEAARRGDAAVGEALARAAGYLAIGVANVVVTLHPELVVIGGGVSGLGDLLLVPLREEVARRVRMIPATSVRIERSAVGDHAGLLGALALAARRGQI